MPMPEEFHRLAAKVSNWGRWGDDDELGTLNLITPEVVRRAAGLVKRGAVFSLAIPLSANGPQIGAVPGRINPLRTMLAIDESPFGDREGFCTSDDLVVMGLQAGTHWDSLAHASFLGRIYNGYPAATITAAGAGKCGIGNVDSLVSRGVLLDVARAKGVDQLDAHALTGDDLDEVCANENVTVSPGDVVLIRTGQMRALHAGDKSGYGYPASGPSFHSVQWFRDHDVAAVATDNLTFEYFTMDDMTMVLPVHVLHLVYMGMTQGQNFDLEALAADCADDGVYEFFFEGSPEPFANGLGAPVNPVAIK